jgi:hypothetical protein
MIAVRAELSSRSSGAVEVSLLARDRAVQAFKDPFAYAASIGVDAATGLAAS